MPTFTHTIEITVEVDYSYAPGALGSRGPFGEPMEPDIPPDVEINSINICDDFVTTTVVSDGAGVAIVDPDKLDEAVLEELRRLAFKNVEELCLSAYEDKSEAQFERLHDDE